MVVGANGQGVALVLRDSADEEADAAVIAEAPVMLALLKETLKPGALEEGSTLRERISAVISAADPA